MNRFRKEEISAASVDFSVPPTPFSWSVSRHLLFRRCRRAYFLHYYLAQGGWDPYADPLRRFTWTAKKSLLYHEWVEHHLEEILRRSFDTLRNVPFPFRRRMLGTKFQKELIALREIWRSREESPGSHDPAKALNELKDALISFLASESCAAITHGQNLTLFNKAFKPSFSFNGLELWYNPGLIWREGSVLASFRIHLEKPSAEFIKAESDMFALSAKLHTGTKDTLSIFRYRSDLGWKEIQSAGNAESAERRICKDAEEMQELASGESVNMLDFPVCTEKQCSSCRFAGVCAAITEQFGEI